MSTATQISSPPASREPRSLLSHPLFVPGVICGLVALVYIGTLRFGFVYDDLSQIVDNDWLTSARYIPRFFTSHVWAFADIAGVYWRPLFLLWLFLNRAIFGLHPAGWHASTVLMHTAATALVYVLGKRLTGRRDTAAIAALIFGLHPALIESVAWVSGVSDPLLAVVLIPAFLFYLDGRQSKRARVLSMLFYVLALMAKEPAVMLLPLVALHAWLFPPVDPASAATNPEASDFSLRFRRAGFAVAPYVAVTVIYLVFHVLLMSHVDYTHSPVTPLNNLLTVPMLLLSYLRLLIWPAPISPDYDIRLVSTFGITTVLVPALLLLAIAALFLYWTRRRAALDSAAENERRVLLLAGAWTFLPILPVLYLKPLAGFDFLHPRYLYLPCMGFGLILAVALGRIREGARTFMGMPMLRAALVAVIVIAMAASTAAQQVHWASNLLLFARGLQVAPHNPVALTSLAIELGKRKQYDKTIALLNESLREDPASWHTIFSLGYTYYVLGRNEEAEPLIEKALSLHPVDADADQWAYLGMTEMRLNNLPKAEWALRNAIRRKPNRAHYHHALGLILEQENRPADAAAEFRETLKYDPANADARQRLQTP
jgi:tetratricopeptide (TPR) repeat protein